MVLWFEINSSIKLCVQNRIKKGNMISFVLLVLKGNYGTPIHQRQESCLIIGECEIC